jgi:hypothetical protein
MFRDRSRGATAAAPAAVVLRRLELLHEFLHWRLL